MRPASDEPAQSPVQAEGERRPLFGLPRPVWLLGLTSLLTDTASEAIYPLLPIYLTRVLGAGAVSLGLIEGFAEAANSVLKILSGHVSDRWRIRRPIVIAGYGLSSAVRPLTALVTSWPQLFAVRFVDRVGKGIRGAPRDALLAACATPSTRGRIFGFHRAMDHVGRHARPRARVAVPVPAAGSVPHCCSRSRRSRARSRWRRSSCLKEPAPETPATRRGRAAGAARGVALVAAAVLRADGRAARLHARQLGRRIPAAAADRRGRQPGGDPAALGGAARGQGGALGLGRREVGPVGTAPRHRRRAGSCTRSSTPASRRPRRPARWSRGSCSTASTTGCRKARRRR